jgi:hypothetical protein
MSAKVVALETFHAEMSWLKAKQPLNMFAKVVALATSQPEIFWSKAEQLRKVSRKSLTLSTAQEEISGEFMNGHPENVNHKDVVAAVTTNMRASVVSPNFVQSRNIVVISVAAETFHASKF